MTLLQEIVETKRRRIEAVKAKTDVDLLVESALNARAVVGKRRLSEALTDGPTPNIIAEFKKASPSKGSINPAANPRKVALAYETSGAAAISVLTEEDYFRGSLSDLKTIRKTVDLPVLRKDFVIDEFQIYEAAASGADAILLIAAILTDRDLFRYREVAEDELGIDALIEVHTEEELDRASSVGATLVGVNNRDLRTFEVSLDVSRKVIESPLATNLKLVAESGLKSRKDVLELNGLGYAGFLIGGHLMASDDPAKELKSLINGNG
ncbi:MAG: indole-3-glycerol phosphate synthase TrpC [Pyrinomonadaceae bacterium]